MLRRLIASLGFALLLLALPYEARASHGGHVLLAEVQIGGENARDEFIELYNPTAASVNLEGWRLAKRTASGNESNLLTAFPILTLAAHGSVLVAHPDSAFAAQADATYSTQQSLASDNTIVLYGPLTDDGRPVFDLLGWGAASSVEGAAAQNPESGQSLERKPGGDAGNAQDTDDNAEDFAVIFSPLPLGASAAARPLLIAHEEEGADMEDTTEEENADDEASEDGAEEETGEEHKETITSSPLTDPSPVAPQPIPTHVRINEFVADPADGDVEWIELMNIGPNAVNLADWVVEDGSERRTILTGALPIGGFFVLEKPKGQLNNAGDRIVLRQPNGVVVDAVTYGDWDDGKISDNAPAAPDPASVARVVDGGDTDNDRLDWVRTETPTKGLPNVVSSVPVDVGTPAARASDNAAPRTALVVLNELYPDPPGDDRDGEFIELVNLGQQAADLAGWRVEDELGATYAFSEVSGVTSLSAGGVLVLPRSSTGIALNNTGGETVRLFKPEGTRAASVASYAGAVVEGASWARVDDGTWSWTIEVTPNAMNIITKPNRIPDAAFGAMDDAAVGEIIVFDGSDSADPDREALTYLWDFGDARTEADVAVEAIARYVYDTPGTYTVALTVTDARGGKATEKRKVRVVDATPMSPVASPSPSPFPSPPHSAAMRLSELMPDPAGRDTDGEWVEIENTSDVPAALAGWAIVVTGSSAQRSLLPAIVVPAHAFSTIPRAELSVALRNDGAVVELVAPSGAIVDSTAYDRAKEGRSYARVDDARWEWTSAPTPGVANVFVLGARVEAVSGAYSASSLEPFAVALSELDDVGVGTDVMVRGVVAAPPRSVGAQIFYVVDGSSGVQVYFGKRDIPALRQGDLVEVRGELRIASDELRIGIRTPTDVRVVGSGGDLEPAVFRIADAADERIGSLVVVEGEVVERRGSTAYIDDGSDEIRVAFSGDDPEAPVTTGDSVRAVGILSRTKSGLRVLARSAADVTIVAHATMSASFGSEVESFARPLRRSFEITLLIAGLAVFIGALWWRRYRERTFAGDRH